MRLLDIRGEPFCQPRCRVCHATPGRTRHRHRVRDLTNDGARFELDLLTFEVPRRRGQGPRILHLLLVDGQRSPEKRQARRARHPLSRLTAREAEVLDLLARGLTTSAIAAELFISPATVRNHVQHILGKLGVHGRLEAILMLLRVRSRQARPASK